MTAENIPTTCPECGRALPSPGAPCPRCTSSYVAWSRSRTIFLTLCGLLLIPMFTVTGVVVRLFHQKQARLAEEWRASGEVNLKAGHAQEAIEGFRNALLYSPESALLQLELAKALAEQGRTEEANVNLELARIASRRGDAGAATKYYHDAMYGQWPNNAHDRRLAARSELIEYFLKIGRKDSARAEALSMAVENPADPDVRVRAGDYLLSAGDAANAFTEFERAQRLEPGNLPALRGAGKAAILMGNFSQAEKFLAEAIRKGAKDAEAAKERDLAAAAAELDPFAANLGDSERRRRVLRIFRAAEERVKACMPGTFAIAPATVPDNLRNLAAERAALPKDLNLVDLTRHAELESKALDWALEAEKLALLQCGPGGVTEQAIALIAAKH